MTRSVLPGSFASQDESLPAASESPDTDGATELPSERSRFSRWLASFGLGETTIPLLRPAKAPRGGAGR